MDQDIRSVIEQVIAEVSGSGEPSAIYLVDMMIRGTGRGRKIEVLVDTDKGIDISQCAMLSRRIRERFESDEALVAALGGDFELMVSSPGLGEAIMRNRQYIRHLGRLMRIVYVNAAGDSSEVTGRLVQAGVRDEADPFIVIEPRKTGKGRKDREPGLLTLRLGSIVRASVQAGL
jgi:ribosome maturation factor RimP